MADENLAESLEQEVADLAAIGDELATDGGDDNGDSAAGSEHDEIRDRNLDLILDIPLKVTVELGRSKMIVSELLNLGQGSVIELTKLAGEPMEVLVNDKVVAKGEAVVVNEKFGVRLTDIVSQAERVEQLNE
ncbi:MAG: flagellar motor switch protein FliN [Bdellovibrionaceae bacterium]|jgi:flagellar motor switch protein FliN|nr:flagellar motor switch protein FliN [Pseudobdellovibrionaceae bacterium]